MLGDHKMFGWINLIILLAGFFFGLRAYYRCMFAPANRGNGFLANHIIASVWATVWVASAFLIVRGLEWLQETGFAGTSSN
jgi:hypothetical protein